MSEDEACLGGHLAGGWEISHPDHYHGHRAALRESQSRASDSKFVHSC